MADSRKVFIIRDEEIGTVRIVEELINVIAALAATEVDGIASVGAGITHDQVKKTSMRTLGTGIRSEVTGNTVRFDIAVNVDFDRNIVDVSREVQERVKGAVETMTGMTVTDVRLRVANVDLQAGK